jgi:hypothetical protein
MKNHVSSVENRIVCGGGGADASDRRCGDVAGETCGEALAKA